MSGRGSRRGWDPWQYLAARLPGWQVCLCDLPVLGALDWERQTIHLDRTLDAAQRRSTLAHEIGHIQRGDSAACPASVERRVEAAAARCLIPLDDLVDALRWSRRIEEVAAVLSVDVQMLEARLDRQTPAERAAISAALRSSEQAA